MRVCCVVWALLECGAVMVIVYLLFDIIVRIVEADMEFYLILFNELECSIACF